jgi:hypothetical protein
VTIDTESGKLVDGNSRVLELQIGGKSSELNNARYPNSRSSAYKTNGKLAQAELKELAQTAERRKRFGIV